MLKKILNNKRLFLVLVVLIWSVSFFSCLSIFESKSSEDAKNYLLYFQENLHKIVKDVLPVVVTVTVNEIEGFQTPWDYFFQDENDELRKKDFEQLGIGSGIIVSRQGNLYYVITNYHVIKGGKKILLSLADEREYLAELLGIDERRDLAVLSFKSDEELPVAKLGNSDEIKVGDFVIAIGAPFGWRSSVTSGIVSALGRRLERKANISNISDFIQTDAGINPGNSGGALINLKGEIIGINTWITSPTGGSIGIGFAIPINNAKKFIESVISGVKISSGWLGVSIARLISIEAEKELGIEKKNGAFVNYVIKASPAHKGGILPGDLIIRLNDKKITDESHLIQLISELAPASEIGLTVIRLKQELKLKVKLALRPSEKEISAMAASSWPGLIAVPLTRDLRERYKIKTEETGLIITLVEADTPAFLAGLRAGDLIKKINKKVITNMLDYYINLNDLSFKSLEFSIIRAGNEETLTLER